MGYSNVVDKERADSALLSMEPPTDYDTWKDVSIAYKAAGGDVDTYLAWCARDPAKYDEKVARKLFENVDEDGAITASTLFYHAKAAGWVDARGGSAAAVAATRTPPVLELDETQQIVSQITALFEPGEWVNVQTASAWNERQRKWVPADEGVCFERDDLIDRLTNDEWGEVFRGYHPEAGAWFCQNPTNGEGRGKDRTVRWRHALVESDELSVEEQIRIMLELDLPIATMTTSGGKSVHALVRVDAEGPSHYAERVQALYEICNRAGLKVDPANKDSSRLTRLAGVRRHDQVQTLIYENVGARDFGSWLKSHSAHRDEPDRTFHGMFRPAAAKLQELPPVLIENTLRKGSIMLVGAAPKVGKSFLAAQMAVGFATGGEVLGFSLAKCERILLVNTEMPAAEYANRIVLSAGDHAEEVARRVRVANTDDDPELTIKDVAGVILDSGYRPDVVIVDPIYPLFEGDENSNADAKVTLGYLKQIASVSGAGVVYMHHFSKGSQDMKEARDRVSGAGTLGRNYSALWSITELAPDESDMEGLPDGSVVVRVSTDLRSFKKSKANRNDDFIAVRIEGTFYRETGDRFESAPTREAARRAEASRRVAQREKNIEKVRRKIAELLNDNGGEPVLLSTVQHVTARSSNTLKDYLLVLDDYQLVKMRVNGAGQKRNHVALRDWQPPLDADFDEE